MSTLEQRQNVRTAQALALTLIPLVALGFARFAYGSILPSMRADLGWTYREAAIPAITNGLGYLIGAATAARFVRRTGVATAAVIALAATTVVTGATSVLGDLIWVSTLRGIAGATGGWAYVAGAIASAALRDAGVKRAVVWYPAGTGVGIVVVAIIGLVIGDRIDLWREMWWLLGLLGVVATLVVRRHTARLSDIVPPDPSTTSGGLTLVGWPIPVAYGLFGAGYIGVATFGTSHLVDEGLTATTTQAFWLITGLTVALSASAWAGPIERLPGGMPLAVPVAGCAVAAALFLVSASTVASIVSAAVFGSCVLTTMAGVTTIIRRRLDPADWGRAFAAITAAFALGQVLGPMLALVVGEQSRVAYWLLAVSTGLLAAAAVVAGLGVRPPTRPSAPRGRVTIDGDR
ncbi:MAG: YbfB/YjiJ family MFS transporter [Actinomycetota bacterium]